MKTLLDDRIDVATHVAEDEGVGRVACAVNDFNHLDSLVPVQRLGVETMCCAPHSRVL